MLVQNNENDIRISPDKYNTLTVGALTPSTGGGIYGGGLPLSESGDRLIINGYDSLLQGADVQYTVNNIDFTAEDFRIVVYNANQITAMLDRKLTLNFVDCMFNEFDTYDDPDAEIYFNFTRCHFVGGTLFSYKTNLYNCFCGDMIWDGIRPIALTNAYDCYFANFAFPTTEIGYHSDGIQIYGNSEVDAHDIFFENCRFEIPKLSFTGNVGTYANACIMVQLEFSSGNNIQFNNCKVNGGGYEVYDWVKNNNPSYTLTNLEFNNLQYGTSYQYGVRYTEHYASVFDSNEIDKLYIGKIWQDENGKIHLSVSNDTSVQRTLKVATLEGVEEFVIPACPQYADYVEDETDFSDFPFDIDIELDTTKNVGVAYDTTIEESNQIRFANFQSQPVLLEGEVLTLAESITPQYQGRVRSDMILCDSDGTPNPTGLYYKPYVSPAIYRLSEAHKNLTNDAFDRTDPTSLGENPILLDDLLLEDNNQQYNRFDEIGDLVEGLTYDEELTEPCLSEVRIYSEAYIPFMVSDGQGGHQQFNVHDGMGGHVPFYVKNTKP